MPNQNTAEVTEADPARSDGADIRMVFSDLDGTLIHYPDVTPYDPTIIRLPASSTGLAGILSQRTFDLCRKVRQRNVPLYFVSGMRFTTLMGRLPYLPRADAYCCDGGGRIFWARDCQDTDAETPGMLRIDPQIAGETPFVLNEDMVWRKHVMEQHVGRDGYIGNELQLAAPPVPIEKRDGPLWRCAQQLLAQGLVLDARGYATCFRINRKQQRDASLFDGLLARLEAGDVPEGLDSSTNLGCIDVYPAVSGKLNCCDYLARRLLPFVAVSPLAEHAVCLCDDDNDIAMAMACHHAFIPAATSQSMQDTVQQFPDHLTVLGSHGEDLTKATERAMEHVLQRLRNVREEDPQESA